MYFTNGYSSGYLNYYVWLIGSDGNCLWRRAQCWSHISASMCRTYIRRVSTVSAWFEVSRVYSSRNSDHECVSVNISFSTWHFSITIFHLFNFIHYWNFGNFIRNLNSTYLLIFWKWHHKHLCSQLKHARGAFSEIQPSVPSIFYAQIHSFYSGEQILLLFSFQLHDDGNSSCKHISNQHVYIIVQDITGCSAGNSIRSRCLSSMDGYVRKQF